MKAPLAVAVCCLALSCDPSFAFPTKVAFITITPDSLSLEAGDSVQLSAQATDSNGIPVGGAQFIWSSNTDSLATVTSHGLVRSLLPGVVSIAASAQAVKGHARVSIGPKVVAVSIDQGPVVTVPGAPLPFTAFEIDPHGNTFRSRPISWRSTDTVVFTVSATGTIQARAAGSAQLVASADTFHGQVGITVVTPAFVSISASEGDHTCGLTADSLSLCWGDDDLGQLGVPSLTLSTAPVTAPNALRYSAAHAGATFTCGEIPGDAPYCWGSNFRGRLGVGASVAASVTPLPVANGQGFHSLSTGWNDTCALTGSSVYCWGENPGAGGASDGLATEYLPRLLTSDSTLVAVDASVGFVCGLTAGGAAYCWGFDQFGQVGDSAPISSTQVNSPSPVRGGFKFVQIGGGSGHACGLTIDGAVYCWGLNSSGQLGTGDTTSVSYPVPVVTAQTFRALDAGGAQTCGLAADSTAYCWGLGTTVPTAVPGGTSFRTLSVGDRHVCGLATDGRAYCWGANEHGQLGDGTLASRSAPTRVLGQP